MANTVVTTARGELKVFGDWLSKFVVAHPKTATIVFSVIAFGLGWFVRGL